MSDIESIGEIAAGGLVARAVEPQAGEIGADGHTHEANCLNCGTSLKGSFCHACGQHAHVHRTIGAFWHDFLHGVLHFEGKIWRTLPMLAWRPGDLTRRYVVGERAAFVSPLALFLFTAFLMFAVFSMIGGGGSTNIFDESTPAEQRAEAEREFKGDVAKAQAAIAELERERAARSAAGQDLSDVDRQIERERDDLALERRLYRQSLDLIAADEAREAKTNASSTNRKADEAIVVATGADSLNQWFSAAYKRAKQNPSLLFYKLQNNAYKWSWTLIPISVPFVWLLFLNRRRYRAYRAYDHVVFVTYSLAFMSMALIVMSVAVKANVAWLMVPVLLYLPVHMYRQLKGAYGLSRFSALWRTVVLSLFSWIALSLFAFVILAIGISG